MSENGLLVTAKYMIMKDNDRALELFIDNFKDNFKDSILFEYAFKQNKFKCAKMLLKNINIDINSHVNESLNLDKCKFLFENCAEELSGNNYKLISQILLADVVANKNKEIVVYKTKGIFEKLRCIIL